jgi:hypothetical protein
MTYEEGRQIRALVAMVEDALRSAASIATRAAGMLEGKEGAAEFYAVGDAIEQFRTHDGSLQTVKSLGLAPLLGRDLVE